MRKSWTICVRCWSRRNSPAVTRWSSVAQRKTICPFLDFLKRELISSLPVLSNTPKLHADIERYARLAMREYEWYNNLSDESCAMPGTFAVFALGLEGEQWAPLVTEYLDLCDDEHSSLQEKFLHALIRKFGFQPWTLGVLVRGALSMQWLEPAKEFRSLIANAESLDALLEIKRRFSAYLLPEETKTRNSGPSLGRACSGLSGARPLKMAAARSSSRRRRN